MQQLLRPGSTLVIVNAGERAAEALRILQQNGADTGVGDTPSA